MTLSFKTQENWANMKVTTFGSLQCDTKHFKHVTNTIMWGSLKYPSNVN